MSRKKASESIHMGTFKDQMEGIVATVSKDTLDEAPGAYKDIFEVMKLQKDSVDVIDYVKPLLNVKG